MVWLENKRREVVSSWPISAFERFVPSCALVVGLAAAISSAADLIEEEEMLLDFFPWHEGRSCLGVDPRSGRRGI